MSESRFSQADREARITLWVYAAFFVWWSVGAFGLGSWAETPLLGLPAWFMVSCVLGYPLVCVALWLVLRHSFKTMPLSADKDDGKWDNTTPSCNDSPRKDDRHE